jgi:hypothetical protein
MAKQERTTCYLQTTSLDIARRLNRLWENRYRYSVLDNEINWIIEWAFADKKTRRDAIRVARQSHDPELQKWAVGPFRGDLEDIP